MADRLLGSPQHPAVESGAKRLKLDPEIIFALREVLSPHGSVASASSSGGDLAAFQSIVAKQNETMTQMMACFVQTAQSTHDLMQKLASSTLAQPTSQLQQQQKIQEAQLPSIATPAGTLTQVPPWPKEKEKKVPQEIIKKWDTAGAKFQRTIEKLVKAKARAAKAKADTEFFKSAEDKKDRYPAGVRPFKSPGEQAELDTPWEQAKAQDIAINVVVPKGATKREAMRVIHWTCTYAIKRIDSDA